MNEGREDPPSAKTIIALSSALSPDPDEDPIAYGRRRAAEIRKWMQNHATPSEIGRAYGLPPYRIKAIAYSLRPKRKAYAKVQATHDHINSPPPTIEEMEREPLFLVGSHTKGSGISPEMSFERAYQMYRWKQAGLSSKQLAEMYGISHERVSQILINHGFPTTIERTWREIASAD